MSRRPLTCQHCGRGKVPLSSVTVRPIRDAPDLGRLKLCSGCHDSPYRTWRLRWDPS